MQFGGRAGPIYSTCTRIFSIFHPIATDVIRSRWPSLRPPPSGSPHQRVTNSIRSYRQLREDFPACRERGLMPFVLRAPNPTFCVCLGCGRIDCGVMHAATRSKWTRNTHGELEPNARARANAWKASVGRRHLRPIF